MRRHRLNGDDTTALTQEQTIYLANPLMAEVARQRNYLRPDPVPGKVLVKNGVWIVPESERPKGWRDLLKG